MCVPLPSKPVRDLATKVQLQLLVIHRTLNLVKILAYAYAISSSCFWGFFHREKLTTRDSYPESSRDDSMPMLGDFCSTTLDYRRHSSSNSPLLSIPPRCLFEHSCLRGGWVLSINIHRPLEPYRGSFPIFPLDPILRIPLRSESILMFGKKSLLEGRSEGGSWW